MNPGTAGDWLCGAGACNVTRMLYNREKKGGPSFVSLTVELLGGLKIALDGQPVAVSQKKARALLAYLALHPGQPQSREKVASLLWGDCTDQHARTNLRQTLTSLRRALQQDHAGGLDFDSAALTSGLSAAEVDVLAFLDGIKSGGPAAIERAMDLYRGDLLEGLWLREPTFQDWLDRERTHLQRLFMEGAEELLCHYEREGAVQPAVTLAERILDIDPLREDIHRILMRLYAGSGRRSSALQQFDLCREVLRRELEVEPSTETEELCEAIRKQSRPQERARAGTLDPARSAIAVLPFTNLSGDPEQDYFSDGITEDIITDLSKVSGLSVVSRNTVFVYKGRPTPTSRIADELRVAYVVEGSVRRAGTRVRISTQLIDAATSGSLWAQRYNGSLGDIFALQDEITRKVVGALKVRLLPEEERAIAAAPTQNIDAYTFYLRGRELQNRISLASLRQARNMFRRAIDLDPAYARALAGLADCDGLLWVHGTPGIAVEGILATAARALRIDDSLAEAHASLGFALHKKNQPDAARSEFEKALELDPECYEANLFYAYYCRHHRQYERASDLLEHATELKSSDFHSLMTLTSVYELLGQERAFRSAVQRLVERAERVFQQQPENAKAALFAAIGLQRQGFEQRAEKLADLALAAEPDDPVIDYNAACFFARSGDRDRAIDLLEHSFPYLLASNSAWVRNDPDLVPLHPLPRYQELLRRLDAASV